MRVADSHWMRIEEYLRHDDRAVLPLGCTEQHAYLSLATDSLLAERVAVEAAEPLGVPVFPALAYGFTPSFTAYPGTVTLRLATKIREMDADARVIVVSADVQSSSHEMATAAGAVGFLIKPMDADDLLPLIRATLAGRRNGTE